MEGKEIKRYFLVGGKYFFIHNMVLYVPRNSVFTAHGRHVVQQ